MLQELLLLRPDSMESIEIDDLRDMLARAYDAGYEGYMGMKGEFVDRIVAEFLSSHRQAAQPSFSFSTSSVGQENVVSPYYLYSTMTVPPLEMVRRDEVV